MSHSHKRKRADLDDSDDEPSLGRQILPVANLPEDFNGEPMDGMQYLFTVRRDARILPHTTRVINPYERPEPVLSLPTAPSAYKSSSQMPSDEWRESFKKHIMRFRKNTIQPTIGVRYTPHEPNDKLMPDKKERDLWWAFLAGRPASDWNPPKKNTLNAYARKRRRFGYGMRSFSEDPEPEPEQEDDPQDSQARETWHINDEGEVELALREDPAESLPTPSGTPAPQEQSADAEHTVTVSDEPCALKPREPTPTLLQHIDQRMSLHLLMYFTHWINLHLRQPDPPSSCLTETHARWIFVLLSRIEEHITADDMSLLRDLARACLALLKEHRQRQSKAADETAVTSPDAAVSDMSERSCWIIISAVVEVWGQRDLWMDAESSLTGI
ncbi:hypothetical protein PLICRDRAFT_96767 [Plicaturopsis crispa FD-325 SS-3]|nr:hypothetical protein PLICRDRAFT_96767 [Plicaturopsis crispa FD-325 SS-3]